MARTDKVTVNSSSTLRRVQDQVAAILAEHDWERCDSLPMSIKIYVKGEYHTRASAVYRRYGTDQLGFAIELGAPLGSAMRIHITLPLASHKGQLSATIGSLARCVDALCAAGDGA